MLVKFQNAGGDCVWWGRSVDNEDDPDAAMAKLRRGGLSVTRDRDGDDGEVVLMVTVPVPDGEEP